MEEILRNAFDKIHADDEMKRRIICFFGKFTDQATLEQRGFTEKQYIEINQTVCPVYSENDIGMERLSE